MAENTAPIEDTAAPQMNEVTEAPQPGANQIQVNVDFLKTTRVHICMP